MKKLTAKHLKEILFYDPATGIFTWLKYPGMGPNLIGKVAGCLDHRGYVVVGIDQVRYYAHRLAWLYVKGIFPKKELDHTNEIKSDNRFENLREAARFQNMANRVGTNKYGCPGVRKRRTGKFEAAVTFKKKGIYLGTFSTADSAVAACRAKRRELFGEFSG